ncbi:PulJ/GspJ family protein [Stutzerimonas kunmingensis]|uniref:PulJ/GspJ family protein n=1 Tax=Stutzerimonas kunmingensis TaxID=1211807 RepID=UPI00241F99C3|nr:type II secretion system protein [Stutzerimonas kunmingensis]
MKASFYKSYRQSGFTLVELIMVIALAGIVAVMISTVMSRPLQGFADQSRRAELTDLAAMALNRMARDIRLAVPNSVRNEEVCPASGCRTLELLAISEGGRYRANKWSVNGERYDPPRLGDCVTKSANECAIEILGPPISLNSAHWLIVYNTTPEDIWMQSKRASPSTIAEITEAELIPAAGIQPQQLVIKNSAASHFNFKYASPQKRLYLADKVVGYRCGGGKLMRSEYSELLDSYVYEDKSPVVVDHVDCAKSSFTYEPGTNTRNGLVTLRLTLRDEAGETITLLQQVHVDNAP